MPEDSNQLPGDPEEAGQQPTEASSPLGNNPQLTPTETGVPEQPSSTTPVTPPQPAPEVYVQPAIPQPSEQPQYPPPPEFYAQELPAEDPYGAPVARYGRPLSGAMFPPAGTPVPPFGNAVPPFPPPPAYAYAYGYNYGYPPPPREQRPLPLNQAIHDLPRQYKKIIFKPGVRSFIEEEGKADWGIIWIQLLFLMVLQIVVSIPLLIEDATMPSTTDGSLGMSTTILSAVTVIGGIVLLPLIFFGTVGIQYLLARMFKGIGSFKQQAYNQMLFQVPTSIVTSLVSLVVSLVTSRSALLTITMNLSTSAATPTFNPAVLIVSLIADLIFSGIGVYSIVLNVFSLMAAHRMSGGRATGSVLIPYGVLFVLIFICVFVFVFVAMMAAINATHP